MTGVYLKSGLRKVSRYRNLGDQSVSVTSIENARDLGALTARIGDVFQVWRVFELVSDVGIGESTDHVLAVEQSAEDLSFIARQRIEGFCGPFSDQTSLRCVSGTFR